MMTPCPHCARTWSTEDTFAGHLMDAHDLLALPAVDAARLAFRFVRQQYGATHKPPRTPRRDIEGRRDPTSEEEE